MLTTHKVDEKELHGFKVSTRALEQLTAQEIRDLRLVFDVFDVQGKGSVYTPYKGLNWAKQKYIVGGSWPEVGGKPLHILLLF